METFSKKNWVLLALHCEPLDRIRLMKTLFLFWYNSEENIPNYFVFEPYLYGPCSFELYSALDELERDGLVIRGPHPVPQWAAYHVTEKGREECRLLLSTADRKTIDSLCQFASFAANARLICS